MRNRLTITFAAVIAGLAITHPAKADFWSDVTNPQKYKTWQDSNLPDEKSNPDICYDVKKDIISLRNHAAVIFSLSWGYDRGITTAWAKQFQHARLCNPKETEAGLWIELEGAIDAQLAPGSGAANSYSRKKAPNLANH